MKRLISTLTALVMGAGVAAFAFAGCADGAATSDTPVFMTVSTYPDTLYDVGEQFSPEGGKLDLLYGGGVTEQIDMTAPGVTLSSVDTATPGQKTVTVSYGHLTTSFVVYVGQMEAAGDTPVTPGGDDEDKVVARIQVVTQPAQTEFFVGDQVDYSGGVLRVTYTDRTTAEVPFSDEGVSFRDIDTSTAGAKTVTVTYESRTTTFTVTMLAVGGVVTFEDYGESDLEVRVAEGRAIERPEDPEREGYTFGGWYEDEAKTVPFIFGDDSRINGDITVYSYWMEDGRDYFDVVYDLNYYGVKRSQYAQIVESGEAARPIAAPQRAEFRFDGWYTDEALTNEYAAGTAISADTVLRAKWTKLKTGATTYTFEAEDTDLTGKTGMSNSGSPQGADMIMSDQALGASGNRFVTYLYNEGLSLEFHIASSEEATATIVFRLAAELPNIVINQENYRITVNGEAPDYGTLTMPANAGFDDWITMEVTLKEGYNIIQLVTNNDVNPVGQGTYAGTAPMVDCIRITTAAVLAWDENYDLPADNY